MDTDLQKSRIVKTREPLSAVTVEVEVFGVYALPAPWKDVEPPECIFKVKVAGVEFNNGRLVKRELTEEELKAQEENKKGPKKDVGKKGAAPPEPTPEELEAQERERAEKEARQRERQEIWNSLNEEEKFYFVAEDIYQSPFIVWEQDNEGDERRFKIYSQAVLKEGEELVKFEEEVEHSGVLQVEFARLPKPPEEDAKKKKKPTEEVKPVYAKGWIGTAEFLQPGIDTLRTRCQLNDLEEAEEQLFTDGCYVYLEIRLAPSITPPVPQKLPPGVQDLIPQEPAPPRFLPSIDSTHDFIRQSKLAVKAIASEFFNMFNQQIPNERFRLAEPQLKEAREKRKEQFLYDFNVTGKSQVLKLKLKKSIVKIARDKFPELQTLKGLNYNEIDRYYSELYQYLVQKGSEAADIVIQLHKELLHEDILVPKEQADKEKEEMLAAGTKEPYEERLSRQMREAELGWQLPKAQSLIKQKVQRNQRDCGAWMEYVRFSLRNLDLQSAKEGMEKIVAILGPDASIEQLLILAGIYMELQDYRSAGVMIHGALEKDHSHFMANLLCSVFYIERDHEKLAQKYFAISRILVKRHIGLLPTLVGEEENGNASLQGLKIRQGNEGETELNVNQLDDMYYSLAEFFMNEKLIGLVQRVLNFINNAESSLTLYDYYNAMVSYWQRNFEEANTILLGILKTQPRDHMIWIYRGHSEFNMRNYEEAEQCYLKSIRYGAKHRPEELKDVILRLGQIYIKQQKWADAKAVFLRSCEEQNTALGWLGLGIACLKLTEYEQAEQAFRMANLLDDLNPDIWGYTALLCLLTSEDAPGRYIQARQCLNQALSYGYTDYDVMTEYAYIILQRYTLEGASNYSDKFDTSEFEKIIQFVIKLRRDSGVEDVEDLKERISEVMQVLRAVKDVDLDMDVLNKLDEVEVRLINVVDS